MVAGWRWKPAPTARCGAWARSIHFCTVSATGLLVPAARVADRGLTTRSEVAPARVSEIFAVYAAWALVRTVAAFFQPPAAWRTWTVTGDFAAPGPTTRP